MGVSIPQPFKSSVSGGISVVGPVQVAGIPDTFRADPCRPPRRPPLPRARAAADAERNLLARYDLLP